MVQPFSVSVFYKLKYLKCIDDANGSHSNYTFYIIFQGDYIKHPVLYELSHKYGFPDNFPESSLSNRLEEIKEVIRREIRKELKVSTCDATAVSVDSHSSKTEKHYILNWPKFSKA